tara:strand:- start:102 stop:539 length:438 start_codon:yes stop_codon:yes gene_type:complete
MPAYEIKKKGKTLEDTVFVKTGLTAEYTMQQLEYTKKQAEKKIAEITATENLHKAYSDNIKRNHECVQKVPAADIKKAIKIFELLAEGKAPSKAKSVYAKDFTAMFEFFKTTHTLDTLKGNKKHYKEQMIAIQKEIDESLAAYVA